MQFAVSKISNIAADRVKIITGSTDFGFTKLSVLYQQIGDT